MPKPELYVIYTGNKGRKPDIISLSQEFFDGADIDIKAKVIYESDKDNIINEYIVFCKVFNEQIKEHGMTKQAVTETIRICKDRNILKQYLSSKEVEVVTIMMSLFDDEQILEAYAEDIKNNEARKTAKRYAITMLEKGRISVEEILAFFPELTSDDVKEIEKGFESISAVVENNSAAAEETSATSEELSAQATALKGMVDRFQLCD